VLKNLQQRVLNVSPHQYKIGKGVITNINFEVGKHAKNLSIERQLKDFDVKGKNSWSNANLSDNRKSGGTVKVPMKCRLDTAEEVFLFMKLAVF